MIYRIFVEKKDNVQARKEAADIKTLLKIATEDFRLVLRYDVEGLTEEELKAAIPSVFSEPPVDDVYLETLEIPEGYKAFAVSYLTGQYDQRADSAAQCVQLLTRKSRPLIKCARVYLVKGVTLPQVQQYAEGTFFKESFLMTAAADADKSEFSFRNACWGPAESVLKIYACLPGFSSI